jgi:AcrR family transcriptional regulator
VLRGGEENLREHLIATAARLIGQRGTTGLSVREIAGEARVADGALYNYFEDKEDLLAHALLAHVAAVMASAPPVPTAGTGTVAENLRFFIDRGLSVLIRVVPAFAGLISQPKVLSRFHAMAGGDRAFVGAAASGSAGTDRAGAGTEGGSDEERGRGGGTQGRGGEAQGRGGEERGRGGEAQGRGGDSTRQPRERHPGDPGAAGLADALGAYLHAEQQLGRIDEAADVDAAAALIVGAIHGQILPRFLLAPPGTTISTPPGLSAQLTDVILTGIAPRTRGR